MNTLSNKSINNLKIIKNLGNDSILSSSSSRDITIQEEFIEVDNINNLESGLYFTFHQCLSDMINMDIIQKNTLISDIDECIQNIYDNKYLNSLMEDESELYKIMDDIDIKHNLFKESYFYNSPFYNYYYKFCLMKEYINNIIENPPCHGVVNFLKEYNKYNIKFHNSGISSDDESDEEEDYCSDKEE